MRSTTASTFAFLASGLGCDPTPPSFDACGDAACRQEWLLQAWAGDPDAVVPYLVQIDDPIEKIAIVEALVEARPGDATPLCVHLPRGPALERCRLLTSRPHLWVDPGEPQTAGRAGGGPPGRDLLPRAVGPVLDGLAPERGPCQSGTDTTCLNGRAHRLARRGQARKAAAHCLAVDEDKWKAECLFRAAEILTRGTMDTYPDAVELCLGSGDFASNCLSHLLIQQARSAPPAYVGEAARWAPLVGAAEQVATHWAQTDPDFGSVQVDRFWSEALGFSYAAVDRVTGDPLDAVPEVAVRHVRAAAAARLLALQATEATATGAPGPGPTRLDLAGWIGALDEALARRAAGEGTILKVDPYQGGVDLWPKDEAGEATIPATVYQSTSRRTLSEDPAIDSVICVLEAAARDATPRPDLLQAALDHDVEAVRWTARRLLEDRRDGAQHQPGVLDINDPAHHAPERGGPPPTP